MFMAQTESESRSGLYTSSIALSKDLLQRLMMEKCLQEDNNSAEDGVREESEDEVELNLGLSLGGCHGKRKKSKINGFRNMEPDLQRRRDGNGDFGLLREGSHGHGSGNFGLQRDEDSHGHGLGSGNFEGVVEFGFGAKEGMKQEEVLKIQDPGPTQEMVEQQKKRELHALRRQEARKKREEKQLQRARREGGGGGGMRGIQSNKGRNGFVPLAPSYASFPMRGGTVFPLRVGSGTGVVSGEEDKKVLGAQMSSLKKKQRVTKQSEACRSDRKEVMLTEQGDPSIEDKSSRTSHEAENMVSSSNGGDHPADNEMSGSCPDTTIAVSQASYPSLPMSYSFPPQCIPVPMGMGFSFPYMMPYWPAAVPSTGGDAPKNGAATPPLPPNVLQPIPTRPFPPFQMPVPQTRWYVDPQTRRGIGTAHSSHASGASSGRSSSAVSEYESRSSQGASSNDTKSQSSTSSALERERLQRASSISKTQDHAMASSEVSTASQLESLKSAEVVATDKVPNNADQSTMASRTTTTMQEKQMTEATSSTKALHHASTSTPPNSNNTESSKDGQSQCQCPLPTMPCVSTTGEGGKTVNGFLYSYTKGEVSIVCVCHGTFLSPAEFVQHAGGTDILHPERHIVVNPSLSAMQDTSAMS